MLRTSHNYNQRTRQNRQLNPINLRDPNLRHKSNNLPFITRALVISPEQRDTPIDELLRAQKALFELDDIDEHNRTPHHSYADIYYHLLERPLNEHMIRQSNREVMPRLRAMRGLIATRLTNGQTSSQVLSALIQDYTYSRFQSPFLEQLQRSCSDHLISGQHFPEVLCHLIQDLTI